VTRSDGMNRPGVSGHFVRCLYPSSSGDSFFVVRQPGQPPTSGGLTSVEFRYLQQRLALSVCSSVLVVQADRPLRRLGALDASEVAQGFIALWRLRQEEHTKRSLVYMRRLPQLSDGRPRLAFLPLLDPALRNADLSVGGDEFQIRAQPGPGKETRLYECGNGWHELSLGPRADRCPFNQEPRVVTIRRSAGRIT
jgi:hypothetical protein